MVVGRRQKVMSKVVFKGGRCDLFGWEGEYCPPLQKNVYQLLTSKTLATAYQRYVMRAHRIIYSDVLRVGERHQAKE